MYIYFVAKASDIKYRIDINKNIGISFMKESLKFQEPEHA